MSINILFFALASISCIIGVVTGFVRLRKSKVKAIHLFSITVLLYLSIVYTVVVLGTYDVIDMPPIFKTGILSSLGVFLLSSLFFTMFIVGCKDGRNER